RARVGCCEEPCVDRRAARPLQHGSPQICPAPLVTETADPRLVIGLEGRGTIGLSHRLRHLHVDIHAVYTPRRYAPHLKYAARKRRVPASAGARCQRSVIAWRPPAISRPLCDGPSLRACAETCTPER